MTANRDGSCVHPLQRTMKTCPPSKEPLVHVAAWIKSIGGVETLLAQHAQKDPEAGFFAFQLALFEKDRSKESESYQTLAFSGRTTPAQMKRQMRAALETHAGAITLWHNGWGVTWFAAADYSQRRIVCLWDSVNHFGEWLRAVRPWVDGVICMSAAAKQDVVRLWPELPAERVQILAVPVEAPARLEASRESSKPWVIGCGGRLVSTQKRAERLVPFVRELQGMGLDFRLEVVSDGPLRVRLERALKDEPRVEFLGWQSREDYWTRLQQWDAAVFFTDHEGGPIVLLEAMLAGVLPVFPEIGGSLADDYLPRVDHRCSYPAGDIKAAAERMRELTQLDAEARRAICERARTLAMGHTVARYHDTFTQFVRRIGEMPRISRPPSGEIRLRWWDLLPLGIISRFLKSALWR